MSIKMVQTLVVTPGTNEQASVNTKQFGLGITFSREFRELANFNKALLFLDCTAVSGGSPLLDTTLQVQDPISQKWAVAATFPQISAVTNASIPIPPVGIFLDGENYRAMFNVTGNTTPTVTCSFVAVMTTEEPIV